MSEQLDKLVEHLTNYRATMDRLFSGDSVTPCECRRYFFDLLVSVANLYANTISAAEELRVSSTPSHAPKTDQDAKIESIAEDALRRRFRERLQSFPWSSFEAENAFSVFTGLNTTEDYLRRFSLHLPEIYTESLRLEQDVHAFAKYSDGRSRADLLVGLQHVSRNHISFVIQALEWAADLDSWNDYLDESDY
jgi:hypothetical protein